MNIQFKNELSIFLSQEIEKAINNALLTDEASKFIVTGHSQAGDKYHAEAAAKLAESYVASLKKLKKEIDEAKDVVMEKVEPVSKIAIGYEDGSLLDFIFVSSAVSLTKYLFISDKSPLGLSIKGKSAGESFSYFVDKGGTKNKFSGKIIRVE